MQYLSAADGTILPTCHARQTLDLLLYVLLHVLYRILQAVQHSCMCSSTFLAALRQASVLMVKVRCMRTI
jgi:hypothetical protein